MPAKNCETLEGPHPDCDIEQRARDSLLDEKAHEGIVGRDFRPLARPRGRQVLFPDIQRAQVGCRPVTPSPDAVFEHSDLTGDDEEPSRAGVRALHLLAEVLDRAYPCPELGVCEQEKYQSGDGTEAVDQLAVTRGREQGEDCTTERQGEESAAARGAHQPVQQKWRHTGQAGPPPPLAGEEERADHEKPRRQCQRTGIRLGDVRPTKSFEAAPQMRREGGPPHVEGACHMAPEEDPDRSLRIQDTEHDIEQDEVLRVQNQQFPLLFRDDCPPELDREPDQQEQVQPGNPVSPEPR